jgi:hypothetical protein
LTILQNCEMNQLLFIIGCKKSPDPPGLFP